MARTALDTNGGREVREGRQGEREAGREGGREGGEAGREGRQAGRVYMEHCAILAEN